MKINEARLNAIISEELSKSEVETIVNSKLRNSQDLEKRIKDVCSEVINNLFRTLWQKNSSWKNSIKQ